ncbi:hypothetical protein [Pyrobaculum sp.]
MMSEKQVLRWRCISGAERLKIYAAERYGLRRGSYPLASSQPF